MEIFEEIFGFVFIIVMFYISLFFILYCFSNYFDSREKVFCIVQTKKYIFAGYLDPRTRSKDGKMGKIYDARKIMIKSKSIFNSTNLYKEIKTSRNLKKFRALELTDIVAVNDVSYKTKMLILNIPTKDI